MKYLISAIISLTLLSCGQSAVKPAEYGQPYKIPPKELTSQYIKPAPQVVVYLPPSYDSSTNRYPVLYMHDGQNLGAWKLVQNMNSLMEKGLMPEIIVVGIYHRGDKRIYDLTPAKDANEKFASGGLPDYSKFLVKEVKPYIDSHYRTLADRKNTGVMGSSLGGISSFYITGWYPDVFGMAGVMSPSFWWNNRAVLGDIGKTLIFSNDVRIYFDGGWREGGDEPSMIADMRDVYLMMKGLGLKDGANLHYYEDPDGSHNEDNWSKRLKMPLLFLFSGYQPVYATPSILLFPPKLGKGDQSYLICWQGDTNGLMKKTIFPVEYKTDKPKIIEILPKGGIKGVAGGTALITAAGLEASISLNVLPESRDLMTVTLKVKAPSGTKAVKISVLTFNEKKTNGVVALGKSPDSGVWTAELKKMRGDRIEIELLNSEGMKGYSLKGEAVKKKIIFTANKDTEIEIGEWK
ncbi:MAG: alpha/beta hydrolase [Brevinematales bacterium]|nr:alpha/beta hydrolase [Brevinematales bacterium]